MAKRDRVFSVGRFEHRMNALEVAREVHLLFKGRERPLAEPYDVEMPEMLIRREVCHGVSLFSLRNLEDSS